MVSAPGNMDDKVRILTEADNYIGKSVNVKYSNITKDGVPFHPVATAFRSKHEE